MNSPVFASTAFAYPNPANENFYPRYFNVANQRVIGDKVAALEGGEAGLVFGSGMAAVSTLLFAWLKPGDHRYSRRTFTAGPIISWRANWRRFASRRSSCPASRR